MQARPANVNERTDRDTWDPQTAGLAVRLRDNPGRQGTTTGRTKRTGSFLLVQVDFGPAEKPYKRYDLLELVDSDQDMYDLLDAGSFGGPSDLRRILTFEKIKGDLTNVFYSMEASNTDFYPHQFKPVLKFIESPVGRLLIADEVGLGKTIESIYIWKELQARNDARRLLVVCPAMLREKWRGDLRDRFNISADIVDAKRLLEVLPDLSRRGGSQSFTHIVSLEALRPPKNFDDPDNTSARARLARLLDENTVSDGFALFDLVVLDEAHYLRNPATASNHLGRLLREAAHHLVLLTATPIQIASDNLYQLIRLIDPDEFISARVFDELLQANAPLVDAMRRLWRQPPDLDGIGAAIGTARSSAYFENDPVLREVADRVPRVGSDPENRVELARMLENSSLLGQYMVRSRKREVLETKAERAPQVLTVRFGELERRLYEEFTRRIATQAAGLRGASLFPLIARQRQMASSLVAALQAWHEKGLLEELLWEDLGTAKRFDDEHFNDGEEGDRSLEGTLQDLATHDPEWNLDGPVDLEALETADTKYRVFRDFLAQELERDSGEKFVVFAFFRGTLRYLSRRLEQDGIRAASIMGGMGAARDDILRRFGQTDGPSVLLSSEVGSEGIDLQFCRFIVNYDLPWNPMRVEQRIGRLDRLGQHAERISIVNLAVEDTIEDRILMRLYERIDLFRDSIGDLEEILGDTTEHPAAGTVEPEPDSRRTRRPCRGRDPRHREPAGRSKAAWRRKP